MDEKNPFLLPNKYENLHKPPKLMTILNSCFYIYLFFFFIFSPLDIKCHLLLSLIKDLSAEKT